MTRRLTPPVCPTCLRTHWEIMSTRSAYEHVHMRGMRFRAVVAQGIGPRPWKYDGVYAHPRYHVAELDRWLAATSESSAA